MAAVDTTLPIFYAQDVHGFYQKQKSEFHFQLKSDNDFLMFLLDTAVRVISIVQHLAPVIEAVSDASAEGDELDDVSPINTPQSTIMTSANSSIVMDVDTNPLHPPVPPLSIELEQINLEITNAQLSAQSKQHRQTPQHVLPTHHIKQTQNIQQTQHQLIKQVTIPHNQTITTIPMMQTIVKPLQPVPVLLPDSSPVTISAVSMNITTAQSHAIQPVADIPEADYNSENKPEIFEIKEEIAEPASSTANLLSPNTIQHLMTSISNNEENIGIQNIVTTANPSNLPPSFLDHSSTNPLSMLGSINSLGGETAGPSGFNIPDIGNIPESMMKNINDAGLNISNIKGQPNPNSSLDPYTCGTCGLKVKSRSYLKCHIEMKHLGITRYKCPLCHKQFYFKSYINDHLAKQKCRGLVGRVVKSYQNI